MYSNSEKRENSDKNTNIEEKIVYMVVHRVWMKPHLIDHVAHLLIS